MVHFTVVQKQRSAFKRDSIISARILFRKAASAQSFTDRRMRLIIIIIISMR